MSTATAPALAPAPTRSTTNLTLQWGLVPVKIRLFTAVEDTNPVKRSQYTQAGNKVIQPKRDSVTGRAVTGDEIVSMVEYDGKLVELTDEEMAEVTSDFTVDRQGVEIQFVPLESIGTRYRVEKWYQARSGMTQTTKRSVPDPHADKAFALLLQSMAKRKVACLFRASLKGPARYAALTPDGLVHFLFYDGEVRAAFEWPDVTITKTEAEQGLQLIDAVGVTEPPLVDERGEALLKFVAQKLKDGKGIDRVPDPDAAPSPTLDLTAALEASLANTKKAPAKTARKRAAAA